MFYQIARDINPCPKGFSGVWIGDVRPVSGTFKLKRDAQHELKLRADSGLFIIHKWVK